MSYNKKVTVPAIFAISLSKKAPGSNIIFLLKDIYFYILKTDLEDDLTF